MTPASPGERGARGFGYERISPNSEGETHFRIHDAQDNAICFCYLEDHAREVVDALNVRAASSQGRERENWEGCWVCCSWGGMESWATTDEASEARKAMMVHVRTCPKNPSAAPPAQPSEEGVTQGDVSRVLNDLGAHIPGREPTWGTVAEAVRRGCALAAAPRRES